jgi:hypothetical protein
VTIPASSAETLLKVQPGLVAPRPAQKVEVLQTLDTRQFAINGSLSLEIKATAQGLVPELDLLLDLEPLRKVADIRQVSPHEGLLIRELSTWGDQVGPRSERLWSITLDADKIRAKDQATEVPFPPARSKDVAAVWQTYEDQDLKVLPKPSVLLDRVKTAPGAGLVAAMGALLLGLGLAGALRQAARLNGLTELAVTKIDVLADIPVLRVAVEHGPDGPVYVDLPGFGDVSGARAWDALPPEAQRYLQLIADQVGVPVRIVSVGAERAALMTLPGGTP